jgi:hypothetical protein
METRKTGDASGMGGMGGTGAKADVDAGERRRARRARLWSVSGAVLVTGLVVVAWSSCGDSEFNFYKPVAEPLALSGDTDAKLERARVLMDDEKYDEAAAELEPVIDDDGEDSNEARLLYAAAQLGVAEMDVWSVIRKVLGMDEEKSKDKPSKAGDDGKGGLDELFDSLSGDLLGSGETRQKKMTALADALTTLAGAPDPGDPQVENTACLFAGILAVPVIADATEALNGSVAALEKIRDSATSGGTECPDIGLLSTAAASVLTASTNFSLILGAAQHCPFLDLSATADLMNQVETQLAAMRANADQGCSELPTCPDAYPDCQSLFPACVQDSLAVGSSGAAAGDGVISSCELMLHCTVPSVCFGL